MQLANFIAVQPLQHILRQPGGVIVKNKLAAGDADNPGAVGPDQLLDCTPKVGHPTE